MIYFCDIYIFINAELNKKKNTKQNDEATQKIKKKNVGYVYFLCLSREIYSKR